MKIEVLEKNSINKLLLISNNIRQYIIEEANELLPEDTGNLLIGILLGDKSGIPEDIIEDFRIGSLSHILAVSGMHTSYVILMTTYILSKSKLSKKVVHVITILVLFLFMFITNFSVSVVRASIMSITILCANLFYRQPDTSTNITLSLLIILVINPFSINDIGLQLSYLGTIGIILFNKNVECILNKLKIPSKVSEILSITISAQIMIMPITILRFNSVSLAFFVSNILVMLPLGIAIILGFITIFITVISTNIAKILFIILNLDLKILIYISHFTSKLPLTDITVKTPYDLTIILFYICILIINYICTLLFQNEKSRLYQRKLIGLVNYKNIKKISISIFVVIIMFNAISHSYILIPKNLEIHFIDVGQGDSCLIITPQNRKILIDGGEGTTDVLLAYLLDKKITKIDYIIISHFDSDHCNGLVEVIEKLKVKNILISKQAYYCDEYKTIATIINSKKINVIQVKQGDVIAIEKDIKVNILYPTQELEYEDLNNNSIVAKISYKTFSMLFTGDIEDSEQKLVVKYKNNELKSTILKVAHHGSKTSSSAEFIKAVNPQIALIGVGKNNTFGHPNEQVIERLQENGVKIYRTDEMGEITIKIDKEGKIKIKTQII